MFNLQKNPLLNPKIIFLGLTILGAIITGYSNLNYIELLSTGDHGRDLYASAAVIRGEMPYKDFWWVYGPVMPYYYGLCNLLFGTKISAVFLGKLFIEITLGVFFYLGMARFMPAYLACIGAIWFLQSRLEFFFTINHIGGIACALGVAYCLFSYLRQAQVRYLWLGLMASFVFMLIKINFGLASLAGLLLSVAIIDKVQAVPLTQDKKKFYALGLIALPLLVGLIYWALLKDLPFYVIRQCMPYFGDDQPHHVSPLVAIPYYLQQHWLTLMHNLMNVNKALSQASASPVHGLIAGISCLFLLQNMIMHGATLAVGILLATKKIPKDDRRILFTALSIMGIFFALYFHEFLVSGVWYRSYWSWPFLMMFHLLIIATAIKYAPRFIRIIVAAILTILILFGFVSHHQSIEGQKRPQQFISVPQGQIYVGNEAQWAETVNTVTQYLNANLKPGELFFALPYDCLYYYLTNKPTPTRDLIFFQHIKITPQQELAIINDLETKKIGYVLMSNRIASSEIGMGIFGQTHCPLISKYIQDNFTPIIRQGGNWQAEPGWGHNHGVIIFKRK